MIDRIRQAWRAHPDLLALAGLLLLTFLSRLPTLANPLTEAHAWRQTQTAWTSLLFAQQGIDLLHSQVPVFGSPFTLPLEFPLFQAAAALLIRAGLGPDIADRLVATVCFMFALVAVYRLGLRLSGRVCALAATVAFAFCPFALLWSRASLIEFLAVALSLWCLELGLAAIEASGRQRVGLLMIATALGVLGLMVKCTTGVFWLIPIGLALVVRWPRPRLQLRYLATCLVLIAVPMLAGLAWLIVSGQIRDQNIFAAGGLDTQENIPHFFGSLTQRLDVNTWITIGGRLMIETSAGLLPLFAVLAFLEVRTIPQAWRRIVWLSIGSLVVLAPLTLVNIYFVHDYYICAILPAVALVIGLAATFLYRHRSEIWSQTLAFIVIVCWILDILVGISTVAVIDMAAIMALTTMAVWVYQKLLHRPRIPGQVLLPGVFFACLLFFLYDLVYAFPLGLAIDLLLLAVLMWIRQRRQPAGSQWPKFPIQVIAFLSVVLLLIGQLKFLRNLPYDAYISQAYDPPAHEEIMLPAAQIAALVPADHWVALIGAGIDYNPAYFYYAHREGLMLDGWEQALGGMAVACGDPRYVLLRLSADLKVTRVSCPDGGPLP